jgi:hypothetical protein
MLFYFRALLMLERGVGKSQPRFRPQAVLHKDGPVIDMFLQTSLASQSLTQVRINIE